MGRYRRGPTVRVGWWVLAALALGLLAAAGACGDDDDDDRGAASIEPCSDSTVRTTSPAGAPPTPGPAPSPGSGDVTLDLEPVVTSGLDFPIGLAVPPGERGRLFVVEKRGRIRLVEDGVLVPAPFLDIEERVSDTGPEQGLLGLAFHPDYAANGRFYVNYTGVDGNTRVSSFQVSADPDVADPATEQLVLAVEQPFDNHNGGQLAFGPDGYLYISLGDGGGGGDPQDNAQDLTDLLGSLLRIDVDGGRPYAVPASNPFAGTPGRCGEIWNYGLRNPWRFSFDRATGDLYIGDVGEGRREEINVAPAGSRGAGSSSSGNAESTVGAARPSAANYGWDIMEGSVCFTADTCDQGGLTLPVFDYEHDSPEFPDVCSVIGGFVYRGTDIPALQGHYLYGDFCAGWIRSLRYENGRAVDHRERLTGLGSITSFGEDADGELYVVTAQGNLSRIVAR